MPRLIQKNLWALENGPFEPQRTDLWQLDLDTAMYNLQNVLDNVSGVQSQRAQQLRAAFPPSNDVPIFARRVELPMLSISNTPVRRENTLQIVPGYDNPPSAFAVTFIHEVSSPTFTYQGSAIWAILETWRALVRGGQTPIPMSPELSLNLIDASLPGTLTVRYAFPIRINLLAGVQLQVAIQAQDDSFLGQVNSFLGQVNNSIGNLIGAAPNSFGMNSNFGLQAVATYQALNAWPSEVVVNALSTSEAAQVLEVRATFMCDSFHVVGGNSQIINAAATQVSQLQLDSLTGG